MSKRGGEAEFCSYVQSYVQKDSAGLVHLCIVETALWSLHILEYAAESDSETEDVDLPAIDRFYQRCNSISGTSPLSCQAATWNVDYFGSSMSGHSLLMPSQLLDVWM